MVSFSIGFNFTTVGYVIQSLKTLLANSIEKMFQLYKNIGYTIKMFLMDREFESIHYSLPEEVNLNTTATDNHLPEI